MSRSDLDHTVKVEERVEEVGEKKNPTGAEGQGSGQTFKRQNEWRPKCVSQCHFSLSTTGLGAFLKGLTNRTED